MEFFYVGTPCGFTLFGHLLWPIYFLWETTTGKWNGLRRRFNAI